MWSRGGAGGLGLTILVFALLLPLMLLRLEGDPVTIDSLICARSVADFEPGFLDGKPAYALLGQPVRALNALTGGDRATLVTLLAAWCTLFAWATLIVVFLIGRDLYGGSAPRAWAAVALLASTPTFLFMSAVLDKYTVTLFFQTLSILLWLRRRYVAAGLAWGAAVGAHAAAALLVVPFAASLRWDPSRKGDVRPALKGTLAAVLLGAPLYGWVLMRARSVGGYIAYLYRTSFGEYSFLAALRPDRFLRTVASSVFAWVVLLVVAAIATGAVVLVRRARARAVSAEPGTGPGDRRRAELRLALLGLFAASGLVLSVYWRHLSPFFRLTGWVLIGVALLRLGLLLAGRAERIDDSDRGRAGSSPEIFTLLIPWLASMAIFFMIWDHFFGQFSIWVAPPLALLAAGLGLAGRAEAGEARGPAPGRRGIWSLALIGLAVLASLWLSRDVVERVTWRPIAENDEVAREARGAVREEGVLIAGWDGPNFAYHHPGLRVLTVVAGRRERPPVWKRDRELGEPLDEIRAALGTGREAYVTRKFLDQPGDEAIRPLREEILRRYDLLPVSPGVRRLAPRGEK